MPRPGLTPSYLAAHVALPLLLGGGIYLVWRHDSLLMFRWAESVALGAPLAALREAVGPAPPGVPRWVLFSLPDGAWVYACVAFFGRLWRDGPRIPRLVWTGIGPAVALGSEAAQYLGLMPGTGDPADVVCYSVAGGVALVFAVAPGATARVSSGSST